MTTRTFRPYDPEEWWLLPPSPREWLPEDHLAYALEDRASQGRSVVLKPTQK